MISDATNWLRATPYQTSQPGLVVTPEIDNLVMNSVAKEVQKLGYGIADEEGTGKMTLYVEQEKR